MQQESEHFSHVIAKPPQTLRIEASSHCQLKCPLCPTAMGKLDDGCVGYGHLSPVAFTQLLDDNPSLESVELSNYGEVFLNKQLVEILALAAKHHVSVNLANGVNLNFATEAQLEALVKFGVGLVTVSIDGATQPVYEKYRVRGKLSNVLKNIETINRYKAAYQSESPELVWQFVAFDFNAHEIEQARSMARDLGMRFFVKQNWDANYHPVDEEILKQVNLQSDEVKALYREQDMPDAMREYPFCSQLWHSPQINWNGDLLGCCINYWQSYGNALDRPLDSLMNEGLYRDTRDMLLGRAFNENSPCFRCSIFSADIYRHNRFNYLMRSPVRFLRFKIRKALRKLARKRAVKKTT